MSSDPSTFRTVGDFALVHKLLKDHALYNIPDTMRDGIINSVKEVFDDPESTLSQKMVASKLILEMDKRNIDIVKIAMPHKVEHTQVQNMSDEELENELRTITTGFSNDRPALGGTSEKVQCLPNNT